MEFSSDHQRGAPTARAIPYRNRSSQRRNGVAFIDWTGGPVQSSGGIRVE